MANTTNVVTRRATHQEPLITIRLLGRGVVAGLLGGVVLAMFMMLVMAANGSGFWSPLNLGISAFAFTIVPPLSLLPHLVSVMGISLPASAQPMVQSAINAGHFTSAAMNKLVVMLTSMHVPAGEIHAIAPFMSGTASNSDVANLMNMLTVSQRDTVMGMMPASPARIVVGMMLHLMMSSLLAVTLLIVIRALRRAGVSLLARPIGAMGVGILGGITVYVVMRWMLLPPTNSMMAFVPQWAFFLAHVMFGAVVGFVVGRDSHSPTVSA